MHLCHSCYSLTFNIQLGVISQDHQKMSAVPSSQDTRDVSTR